MRASEGPGHGVACKNSSQAVQRHGWHREPEGHLLPYVQTSPPSCRGETETRGVSPRASPLPVAAWSLLHQQLP